MLGRIQYHHGLLFYQLAWLHEQLSKVKRNSFERRMLSEYVRDLEREIEGAWASRNELSLSVQPFPITTIASEQPAKTENDNRKLSELLAYPRFFNDREGRASVIVAHVRGHCVLYQAREIARDHGLEVHTPPRADKTWISPGEVTMLAFTKPDREVYWLLGQGDG